MLQLCASSLSDTHAVAGALAALARSGDIIVLSGEMGAGKTAFAQGFGRALGVTEPITSPTFTLVHSYDCGRLTLHHADLYRLDHTGEVADLALAELAEFDGVVLVEWGEVADNTLGDHLVVHLEADDLDDLDEPATDGGPTTDDEPAVDEAAEPVVDTGRRLIELSAVGPSWATRWAMIAASCEEFAC